MASLLTAKQRKNHPQAQLQSLVRIGRRALVKADWLEDLQRQHDEAVREAPDAFAPTSEWERAHRRREIRQLREKAAQASEEALALARAHGLRPDVTARF